MFRNAFFALVALIAAAAPASAKEILVPYGTNLSGTVSCYGKISGFKVIWVREGGGSCDIDVNLASLGRALATGATKGNIEVFGGICTDDSLHRRAVMPYELKGDELRFYPWRKKCDTHAYGRGVATGEAVKAPPKPTEKKKVIKKKHPPVLADAPAKPRSPKPAPQARAHKPKPAPAARSGDCCEITINVVGGTVVIK